MREGKGIFGILAASAVFFLILFLVFVFGEGVPILFRLPLAEVLFGVHWDPGGGSYGMLPMLAGTCLAAAGAMALSVPLGVLTAVYLTEYCPEGWAPFFLGMIRLLSGLPSVVYGFFGLVLLVPQMRRLGGESGMGLLTAAVLLGFMVLPTIVQLSVDALQAVPVELSEGARALGADREQGIFMVKLPAAGAGIRSAAVAGTGRALGETMAVSMVAGNQAMLPQGIFSGFRTLTSGIALEIGYAAGEHREALFAMGVLLLLLTVVVGIWYLAGQRR